MWERIKRSGQFTFLSIILIVFGLFFLALAWGIWSLIYGLFLMFPYWVGGILGGLILIFTLSYIFDLGKDLNEREKE